MSIEAEIYRLVDAKQNLHSWLEEQGVTVPENPLLGDLVALLPLTGASSHEGVKMMSGTSYISNGEVQVPGIVVDERDFSDGLKCAIAIHNGSIPTILCMTPSLGQYTNSSMAITTTDASKLIRIASRTLYWMIDPDMTAFQDGTALSVISFWNS